MSRHDDRVTLQQMWQVCEKAMRYAQPLDRETLEENEVVQDAIVRQLEVLGEASARVSPGFAQAHPDWPWRQMKDLRRALIHGYDAVDLDDVWATLRSDLPGLRQRLEAELGVTGG